MSKAHFTTLTLSFLQQNAQATNRFLSFCSWCGKSVKLLFLFFFLVGCVSTVPLTPQNDIRQLSTLLQSLDENVSQTEAMKLSKDIFHKTQLLSKEFELTSPPLWHNFLVNVGIREKGLCYHWSDALYVSLSTKKYISFDFHLMGADIGKYFLEHNALVVVAKGGKVEDGIIIDPWRDSGKVYFSKVSEDTKYKWIHRIDRGCR